MPKKSFKEYYEERVEMEKFGNIYQNISGFDLNQKNEFVNKIDTKFSFTRMALDTAIMGGMLSKYTYQQIYDPYENEEDAVKRDLENERNKLYSMVHKDEPLTEDEQKEFLSHMADCYINVVLGTRNFINDLIKKDNYSFEKLSLEEREQLLITVFIHNDAHQEMARFKELVGEKYKQLVDKDGERDALSYYEELSDIATNTSIAIAAQTSIQQVILGMQNIGPDVNARSNAEHDADDLIMSFLPNSVTDSAINNLINKQDEKDVSKMDTMGTFNQATVLAQFATSAIPKDLFTQMLLNPATRDTLLSQIVDADKSKTFSIDPESGEVSFEPLINFMCELEYGPSELDKHRAQTKESIEFINSKIRQFTEFTDEQKKDFSKGLATKYTVGRTAFDTLFWGRMLLKGHSIDELLDFNENSSEQLKKDYADVKKEFFEEKLPKEADINNIEKQKEFDTYAAEAYTKVIQEAGKLHIGKMKEKLSYANFSPSEKQKSDLLNTLIIDAFQERGRIEKSANIGEADLERIVKEQNPGNENAWNEFKELNNPGVSEISSSIKFHEGVTANLANLANLVEGKTAKEIMKTTACSTLRGTIAEMVALKMTERACADSIKNATIGNFQYTETFGKYFAQVESLFSDKKSWADDKTLAGILSNRLKLDAFMNALSGNPEELCTIKGDEVVDFYPINEKARKINKASNETLAQERNIRKKVVEIADMLMASAEEHDNIKNLSDNEKIEKVMNLHCMANGSGHIYGEEYNDNNPNASRTEKVNNYINELIKDAKRGNNVEMYAYLPKPNQKGEVEYHKINNYIDFTFEKEPSTLFGSNEKSYKIQALEELKEILEKNGETSKDSEQYKQFKKCLDESIEPLKRTLSSEKKDEILNELASKADAYYIAKLDSSQNNRRSVRFNAASVIRNINQDNFNKKVNMKQAFLEKVAYIYAKDKVKNGTQAEKDMYKKVTDPYDREQLGLLAETISMKPNIKKLLDNCKDDKQLKTLFDKVQKIKDIPNPKADKSRFV